MSEIWGTPRPATRLPGAALLVSVAFHGAVLVALFTFTFSDRITAPPMRARALTLLAPLPPLVRVAIPRERVAVLGARRFHAPTAPARRVPRRELVTAPVIDIPRPALALLELRPVAPLPAPPLRTDNLASPVVVTPVAAPVVVRAAGFSGVASAAQPALGTLRPSGFESAFTRDVAAPFRPLARAGFDDATVSAGTAAQGSAAALVPVVTRPLEILAKPKPVYTDEARRKRIEGEVLLHILFSASGQVQVLGVVRGLGYGLDEHAIAAAEAIRFRPAERAGVPADSTAIVHIVFQLAY